MGSTAFQSLWRYKQIHIPKAKPPRASTLTLTHPDSIQNDLIPQLIYNLSLFCWVLRFFCLLNAPWLIRGDRLILLLWGFKPGPQSCFPKVRNILGYLFWTYTHWSNGSHDHTSGSLDILCCFYLGKTLLLEMACSLSSEKYCIFQSMHQTFWDMRCLGAWSQFLCKWPSYP